MNRMMDRTFDPGTDAPWVAQMNALGAIADDVVSDVIRAGAGRARLSECAAVGRAADLISFTLQPDRSGNREWTHERPDDAVRWLSSLDGTRGRRLPHQSGRIDVSLSDLDEALQAARRDSADDTQLSQIRRVFEYIGQSTLDAARSAIYGNAWR